MDLRASDSARFAFECELVQLWAHPAYSLFLAREGLLARPGFARFCRYLLETWSQPSYVRHLLYPVCLVYLRLCVHDSAAWMERLQRGARERDGALGIADAQVREWAQRTSLAVALADAVGMP